MPRPHDDRTAFRCSVAPENSGAKLKIGSSKVDVSVLDTSRHGFTVRMLNKLARKLKVGRKYELTFAGETWEVEQKSDFTESKEFSHVGFARVRDLTKVEQPRVSWWPALRKHVQADPAFLMFLVIVFVFMCVALPGVGDKLGTAPKVKDGVHTIMDTFKGLIR